MLIRRLVLILAKILVLLMIVDPSGDLTLTTTNPVYIYTGEVVRIAILVFSLPLVALSLYAMSFKYTLDRTALYCLTAIIFIVVYGAIVGIIENRTIDALNEASAMGPLLFIPALLTISSSDQAKLAKYIAYTLIAVCTLKFVLSQVEALLFYGMPSWKVLLRQSALLVFPYSLLLIRLLTGTSRYRTSFLIAIVIMIILSAQARALNAAVLLATMIVLIKYRQNYNLRSIVLFFIAAIFSMFILSVVSGVRVEDTVGFWSGDIYEDAIDYRVVQSAVLTQRIIDRPLSGFGFGYFTPTYLTYGDLDKPYQLELDLPNFATKIGIIVFAIYLGAYYIYYRVIFGASRRGGGIANIDISYSVLILSLLFYSCFQTFHASILYWLFYAISFSFLATRVTGSRFRAQCFPGTGSGVA